MGANTTLAVTNNFNIGLSGAFQQFGGVVDPTNFTNNSKSAGGGNGAVLNVSHTLTNNGIYTAQPGDFTMNVGTIAGNGTLAIGDTGDLILNATTVLDTQAVAFENSGTPGILTIGTVAGFDAVTDNFNSDAQIVVETTGNALFSQSGSVVSVIVNGVTLGALRFDSVADATLAKTTPGALSSEQPVCFLKGTQIATPSGDVPVEQMAIGDLVRTHGGDARPIVWIGTGRVLATRGRRTAATPVIVRRGALGPNLPHRDLRVTKAHSLYLDDVLIPVEFLVNHRSIVWDDQAQEVSIYHIELETHDVLVANGAPAESYRDDGNRWLFQNANSGWGLPPQEPCAPVLTGGKVVDAVWRRLLDLAGPRPGLPLTDDPDLHVLIDGWRLDAASRRGDAYVFQLPALARSVHIASRAAVPAELGVARDPRQLGVALRRIVLRQGTRFQTIDPADLVLTEGFHEFEPDTGIRWTDGDAVLPAAMLNLVGGPKELVLQLGGRTSYLEEDCQRQVA
jgi:Hint domain